MGLDGLNTNETSLVGLAIPSRGTAFSIAAE